MITTQYELLKAVPADLDTVESIYNESIDWLLSRDIHQWRRGVYPTRASAEKALTENCLYLCRAGNDVAGTAILNEFQPKQYASVPWKFGGRAFVVHTLAIRPSFCGRGAGAFLMSCAEKMARETACDCMRLDVFPDNPDAVALYRRLGFARAGEVRFDQKEPTYEWYDCYEKSLSHRKEDQYAGSTDFKNDTGSDGARTRGAH